MPYLTTEERHAIDRDHQRQERYKRCRELVERSAPERRHELLVTAIAAVESALRAQDFSRMDELGYELYAINSAVGWVSWGENDMAHRAAIPSAFPYELPTGAPIFYGTHHGKRFDGVAKLRTYQSQLPGYTHETCRDYEGEVDGEQAFVPASYINWRELPGSPGGTLEPRLEQQENEEMQNPNVSDAVKAQLLASLAGMAAGVIGTLGYQELKKIKSKIDMAMELIEKAAEKAGK